MSNPDAVAKQITEELAAGPIKLVASLPDNWIMKELCTGGAQAAQAPRPLCTVSCELV